SVVRGCGSAIPPASGGASFALHVECEVGSVLFFFIVFCSRDTSTTAIFTLALHDALPIRHRNIVVGQTAGTRQRGDLHRRQSVRRGVIRIGEAKIRRRKGVGGVLQRGDGLVGPRRRVVHRGDVDRKGIGRLVEIDPAIGGA